jgi:curli biogenesis system outer membrane secretion channel CsgG
VQVQPSEQDQTQTQPVAPVDPSAQTVAVASSTASPNALPQPTTGVCTDPGAAPPAQGTPDFGGVRQVSCQIEGLGLTPSLASVAALQSAVGQVNGVGVANRLQGLRAALDVDINGAHVAAIDMRSFSQRVILASQGAITSYDVLSQQQVSNPNKSSYWKTLIRANVAKYSAPDESGRPKIIIAPPRIGATSYVVGDARVPAAEVSRAIAARLSDILTQTHRFIVLDRDFSDESQIEFDHIAGGNVRLQDAARLGEQFATDLILVPVIERFEYPRQTRQLRMSDRQLVSYSGGGRIALRLLNATTGEVVMSDTFDYTLPETTASTLPRTIDGPGIAATMMSALAGQIGDAVIGEIFPVAVVSVDGNQVILSQGGAALQPGQRWRAMALGQPLSDPQTGRSLGRDERPCCTIRIDRVAAQVSYGVVEEGADMLTTAFNSGAVVLREKTRAR